MTSRYEIVPYEPAYHDQVMRLQRHLWGPDLALNAAYFDWKFVQNPYQGDVIAPLVLHNGEVVGMRALMGAQWQWGHAGDRHPVLCAGDLVVAPEHRGNNLFRPIMAAAIEDLRQRGHQLLFNFSASPFTCLASLRSGWRLVAPYQMLRWHNPRRATAQRVRDGLNRLPLVWRMAHRRLPVLEPDPGKAVEKLSVSLDRSARARELGLAIGAAPSAAVMGAMAARRSAADDGFHHVKDAPFYRWRFANPLSRYFFLHAGGAEPSGYVVLRTDRGGRGRDAAIVDWEADDAQIFGAMVAAVCDARLFDTISIWSATLADNARAGLSDLGFRAVAPPGSKKFTPGPLVYALQGSGEEAAFTLDNRSLLEPAAWDLRMIFSDEF